jgi:hypothetical protein
MHCASKKQCSQGWYLHIICDSMEIVNRN